MKSKLVRRNFHRIATPAGDNFILQRVLGICLLIFLGCALQSNAQMVQRVNGTDCVGANNVFVLSGASSCGSVFWNVSGSSYTIITQTSTSITVKWNVPTPNAYVTANYSGCSFYPYSGSAYSSSINITNPLTPAVSIAASQNGVCATTSITFTASPTNGGSPYYNWKVNGNPAPGSTNASTYTTSSLTNGQVVSCVMTSSLTCLTSATATSNSITMSLTNPGAVSVSISSTTLPWCNGVGSFNATPVNGGSSPVYTWYKNNVVATDNQSGLPAYVYAPINPLSDGVVVKCVVTSNQACISGNPATSNEITVTTTAPIDPILSISPSSSSICDGDNITFTASSPQAGYAFGSFSWTLNGIAVGTNSSTFSTNQLTSSSIIGLTATFTGSCVSPTSKTASLSGITVKPLPLAGVSPSGNLKICSTCSQQIYASPTGAGHSYVWKKDGNVIGGESSATYTTSTAGTYLVEVTNNGCMKAALPLILTKNVVPVANAGVDKVITLPTNTVTLSGSGSDPDGTISSYFWSKISGEFGSMSGESTPTLTLTNLSGGNHIYRLTVTDNFGETKNDDVSIDVNTPANDYNRVLSVSVMVPAKTTESQVAALPIGEKQEVGQYFDGLGRVMQTVSTKASPASLDIVQPSVYDAYQREVKRYMPFTAGTTGYYQINESIINASGDYTGAAAAFYLAGSNNRVADDTRPYSETIYEPSPLNRPSKIYRAGQNWYTNAKFSEEKYLNNAHGTLAGQEKIISWKITGGMPVRATTLATYVESGGYYSSNQLNVKVTIDEQQNAVREYTNKKGQVVLKKVQAVAGTSNLNGLTDWALTYYIYDDLGNLRFVFQPELSRTLHQNADTYVVTTGDLTNFAFQYKYDLRNRMTEKRVPGGDWVYMVYDSRDRIVLKQDGNQRAGATNAIKYWTFTKYDELNRPIATGIKDTTTTVQLTQVQMQAVVDTYYSLIATTKPWRKYGEQYIGNVAGNVHGYSNKSYPVVTAGATVNRYRYLTITYYDRYDFTSLWSGDYSYKSTDNLSMVENGATYQQPSTAFQRVVGQVAGISSKVMDGGVAGGYRWLNTINYYDENQRVIQVQTENYRGGTDRISNLYNFTGQLIKTKTTHDEGDTWKDIVGVQLSGRTLTRTTAGATWGASGAASVQQLPAAQDGWVEFTTLEINKRRMLGLSDVNSDANYTSMDYAWYPTDTGILYIFESGTNRGTYGSYAAGDVLKIERTGTVVKYYQNGVLKYTSTVPSSTLLMADFSIYDVSGTVANVRTSFGSSNRTIVRRMEYDHSGRLVRAYHQVDNINPEVLLVHNTYNELGQLVDKKLHSVNGSPSATDAKQSVDYRYNIRGWLSSMNNSQLSNDGTMNDDTGDYFGMNLGYETDLSAGGNSPLYNGNISAIKWSNFLGQAGVKEKSYSYAYDAMSRVTSATFKEKSASWNEAANGGFKEPSYTYDLNGNIMSLTRYDKRGTTAVMDNLSYNYGSGATQSNRLLKVTDGGDDFTGFTDGANAGDDYTYDANGNMITDQNKGITTAMTYNYLNLPEVVSRGGNTIRYIYDASGRKISQLTTFGTVQKQADYIGEFNYENDALQFIQHEEGRIVMSSQKDVYMNDGSSLAGVTSTGGATPLVVTLNNQTYIRVTSTGTQYDGIFPLGGVLPAIPGERYRIRVKGYKTSTQPVYILARTNLGNLLWSGTWYGSPLPGSAQTESWIEETVTIPSGATTLEAGVIWNTTVSGNQFFVNEVVITRLAPAATPEYQYHLKDHLGNVRLTFTTKQETESGTATMETVNATDEQGKFLYYTEAIKVNQAWFDHTNIGGTFYSTRLTGGTTNAKYGLAKSLAVMPGDVINTEVYAKYLDTNTANWTAAMNTFITSVVNGTAPAGTLVDGGAAGSIGTGTLPITPLDHSAETGTPPKAYLNYIVFDKDMNVTTDFGFIRLTTAGREYGQDGAHELLSKQIVIKEPGYVYIYLSNENPTEVEVYFDDFKVEQIKSAIVQMDDYYPFGLTFYSYGRENTTKNNFLYNGFEIQNELDLGWYDYQARQYDPATGRFLSIDPLADVSRRWSPYVYGYDNPIRFSDPDGMLPEDKVVEDDRPKGATVAKGTHVDRTITVTRSGKEGEYSHTVQETHTTTNGSYERDSDDNLTWKESKSTTTTTTVLDKNGDVVSSSQSTNSSETVFAVKEVEQATSPFSSEKVSALGDVVSSKPEIPSSNKIRDPSNEFKAVVAMTGDYSRMTNGLSITQLHTNYMVQSLSNNLNDNGLPSGGAMVALSGPALSERNPTMTYYKSCGDRVTTNSVNNEYRKAIATGTAGYIRSKK